MRVTIHVRADMADALRSGATDPDADRMRDVAREAGGVLAPLHPDTADRDLAATFTLDVADPRRAAEAAYRLGALSCVESAYVKPADEPPG